MWSYILYLVYDIWYLVYTVQYYTGASGSTFFLFLPLLLAGGSGSWNSEVPGTWGRGSSGTWGRQVTAARGEE